MSVYWEVYAYTKSAANLGFFVYFTTFPNIIITPLAGILIDRIHRWKLFKKIITILTFISLLIALMFHFNLFNLYLFGFLILLFNSFSAFDMPLRQVIISSLVPPLVLTQALSLQALSFHSARILGSSLGGLILSFRFPALNFWINALSYLPFLLFACLTKPLKNFTKKQERISLREALLEVIKFCRQKKILRILLWQTAFFSFFGVSFSVLLPKFAAEILKGSALEYGILSSLLGIGAIFGALNLSIFHQATKPLYHLLLTQILFSLSLVLLRVAWDNNLVYFSIFLMGFSFTNFFPLINSTLQRLTPESLRGRVMSLFTLCFTGTTPFGQLFFGIMGEEIALKNLLLFLSAVIILISLFFYFSLKGDFRLKGENVLS